MDTTGFPPMVSSLQDSVSFLMDSFTWLNTHRKAQPGALSDLSQGRPDVSLYQCCVTIYNVVIEVLRTLCIIDLILDVNFVVMWKVAIKGGIQ